MWGLSAILYRKSETGPVERESRVLDDGQSTFSDRCWGMLGGFGKSVGRIVIEFYPLQIHAGGRGGSKMGN